MSAPSEDVYDIARLVGLDARGGVALVIHENDAELRDALDLLDEEISVVFKGEHRRIDVTTSGDVERIVEDTGDGQLSVVSVLGLSGFRDADFDATAGWLNANRDRIPRSRVTLLWLTPKLAEALLSMAPDLSTYARVYRVGQRKYVLPKDRIARGLDELERKHGLSTAAFLALWRLGLAEERVGLEDKQLWTLYLSARETG